MYVIWNKDKLRGFLRSSKELTSFNELSGYNFLVENTRVWLSSLALFPRKILQRKLFNPLIAVRPRLPQVRLN